MQQSCVCSSFLTGLYHPAPGKLFASCQLKIINTLKTNTVFSVDSF